MPRSACAIDVDAERREQPPELAQLALVVRREHEARDRHADRRVRRRERRLLRRDELADAALGKRDQRVHLGARERRAFGRALHLDEAAARRSSRRSCRCRSPSPRRSRGRAAARRRRCRPTPRRRNRAAASPVTRPARLAPRDRVVRRATHAPVIDAQRVPPSACSTSQSILIVRSPSARKIGHRAQAAADQPLDLLRASRLPALRRLAPRPRVGRARQHPVLGGEPALALALQERRHAFLDARRAEDLACRRPRSAPSLRRAACSGG